MKKLLLVCLMACGDNITEAPPPDGAIYSPDSSRDDLDIKPEEPQAEVPPDAPPTEPVCDDSHIELNGHEHKCQHDMDLP